MQSVQRLLACFVLLIGCSPSESQQLSRTFERFPELAEYVNHADELTLYEGLPHPGWERDRYAEELAKAKTIDIDDHRFYEQPVVIEHAALTELRRLCSTPSLFKAMIPDVAKACGGYHPDWCLVWTKGNESRRIHFCFGCHDVKAYDGDELVVQCEMRDVKEFQAALNPLHANRPLAEGTSD